MATSRSLTTKKKAESYELVKPLLDAMYEEFKELSKKKPDGVLSKYKIAVVNRLLGECRGVLETEPSFAFLDLLDEDNVPQNSDVVLILSQYLTAMKQFKEAHWSGGFDGRWLIPD